MAVPDRGARSASGEVGGPRAGKQAAALVPATSARAATAAVDSLPRGSGGNVGQNGPGESSRIDLSLLSILRRRCPSCHHTPASRPAEAPGGLLPKARRAGRLRSVGRRANAWPAQRGCCRTIGIAPPQGRGRARAAARGRREYEVLSLEPGWNRETAGAAGAASHCSAAGLGPLWSAAAARAPVRQAGGVRSGRGDWRCVAVWVC